MNDTLMPEVHDALARAVAARGAARARRKPWWTRRAGLLAIGAVVVSGSAVATTGVWQPTLGDPQHGGQPRAAGAGVPTAQLQSLAVLRRPQTAADRGPLVRAALRRLDRASINGIHVDGIRVLFRTPREIAVLVPAERVGPKGYALRHVLCLMSSSYDFRGWGMSCGDVDQLRSTGIQTGTSPSAPQTYTATDRPGPTVREIALVPDGVARVTVRLRHGRSVTVPVHDNTYKYVIHESPAMMGTIWYDAAGQRIDHRRRRP
jgi:hypothetical protein